MTLFVGLGHYSRTGKDSFANAYVDCINKHFPSIRAHKVSFARKLKEVAHTLYGWAGLQDEAFYNTKHGEILRQVPLEKLGGLTPVDVWVRLGTPAIREQVYQRTWIDLVLEHEYAEGIIVIPDVRFPNEVEAIRAKGGKLYKIVRPGYGPLATVADQALLFYDGWDQVFGEDGDFTRLKESAQGLAIFHACNILDGK